MSGNWTQYTPSLAGRGEVSSASKRGVQRVLTRPNDIERTRKAIFEEQDAKKAGNALLENRRFRGSEKGCWSQVGLVCLCTRPRGLELRLQSPPSSFKNSY
jgi:hypothetical protein